MQLCFINLLNSKRGPFRRIEDCEVGNRWKIEENTDEGRLAHRVNNTYSDRFFSKQEI